jgi:dihydrofolate reductase
MGRLIISNQMTVDGVIEAPTPDKWLQLSGEHEEVGAFDQLFAADAVLLGRKTYEGLAGVWPNITDERGFADRINRLPKYVVSRTLQEPLEWNATLIKGDLTEEVTRLKRQPGGNLVVYGCGEFAYHLTTLGLVDELRFWVHPIVWGSDKRVFHEPQPVPLELTASTTYSSGVTLLCYQPLPNGETSPE